MGVQLSTERLSAYFERRSQVVRNSTQRDWSLTSIEALLVPVLRMAEELLQEQLGRRHYELSVWAEPSAPQMLAYYNSEKQERPRTYSQRQSNPLFYRENNYEVIGLLDNPEARPIVLNRLSQGNYVFQGTEQMEKIRSTILYCFDHNRPAAIVLTCNEADVFGDNDVAAMDLVRCVSMAIRADLDFLAPIVAAPGLLPSSQPQPQLAYSWVHLSDIHFGAGSTHHQFDQSHIGDAILNDLHHIRKPVNRIFVTGDIAFKGAASEYSLAQTWLRAVAKEAGVESDCIRIVPGNHDVQRDIDTTKWQATLKNVRANPQKLDEELKESRDTILARLSNYSTFVRDLTPGHPKDAAGWIGDWSEEFTCAAGSQPLTLRIVGLSTVLISDADDGLLERGKNLFLPNMVLALSQLQLVRLGARNPNLVMVLTHHPMEWLHEISRKDLQRSLAGLEHLQLCGHIHVGNASEGRYFGKREGAFRFSAGAAHDEEPKLDMPYRGEHGYGWGAIRLTPERTWQLGWAPRVFVPSLNRFRADRTRHDLDEHGFAWANLNVASG
jgi:hypothetical protein